MKRRTVHKFCCGLLLLMPAMQAFAAEEAAPEKKFIPLDKARATQAGVRVVRPLALRSDRDALRTGTMRSDFAPKSSTQVHSPLIVPVNKTEDSTAAKEEGVSVQRGGMQDTQDAALKALVPASTAALASNSAPVLGLYDDNEEPLLSFRDAMSGMQGPVSPAALGAKQGWPLPTETTQKFTSGFGMRADPISGKPAFHGGIDLAAEIGTPVLATAPGKVLEVADDPRYGKYITIEHGNGAQSRYGHLLGPAVRVGQVVSAGQMIGALGATGRVTGPHLDFRYRVNGQNVDPMRILTPPRESLKVAGR